MLKSFKDFIHNYRVQNKATSIKKTHQLLSYLHLNDVGIYWIESPFIWNMGVVILYPSRGMHWVLYVNQSHFDAKCASPREKLSKFNNTKWVIFIIEHRREFYCAAYCLYTNYLPKVAGMDFKIMFRNYTTESKKNFLRNESVKNALWIFQVQ